MDSGSKVQLPPRKHNMHQCICQSVHNYRHAYAQSAHTHLSFYQQEFTVFISTQISKHIDKVRKFPMLKKIL